MDTTVQIAVGVVAVLVFFGSEAVTWALRSSYPHYLSELFSLLSEHATPGADAVFRRYVADVRGVWLGTLGEEAHEHLRRWNERQNESTNSVERR